MIKTLKLWTAILIATIATSLIAIAPAPASAYKPSWIPAARYIADRAWSPWGNPCGNYPIRVVSHLPNGYAALSTWNRSDASNWMTNNNCLVRLAWDQVSWRSWPVFCTLMVHERGHLSFPGPWHSGNRANVMYPGIDRAIFPGCK